MAATKLTKDQKLELLRSLKRVINTRADRRPCWFAPDYGLCMNFEILCGRHPDAKDLADRINPFKKLFFPHVKTWPHYSGDKDFYVPATPSKQWPNANAESMYGWTSNMYDRRSPYCRLRHDLLDHVIACVEAEGA